MEHEFETIRSKVKAAEQNTVAWEKELIWSKLNQERSGKPFVFYYAAASFLLASAIFFYAFETTKQKHIDLALKAIELSIEENKLVQANLIRRNAIHEPMVCVDEVADQVEKDIIVRAHVIKKSGGQKIVLPSIIRIEKQKEILNNTVAQIEIKEEDKAATKVLEPFIITQSTNQVQAIIGGGYETPVSPVTKDKKIKFRFFRAEENTESVPAAAETLSLQSKFN